MTALIVAAIHGKAEVVKALLNRGVDINATDNKGMTALMWAARNGRKDVVQVLLEKGADVNAKDKQGKNALDLAGYYRQEHTKALLLKAGAGIGKGSGSLPKGKPGEKPPAAPPSTKGESQERSVTTAHRHPERPAACRGSFFVLIQEVAESLLPSCRHKE